MKGVGRHVIGSYGSPGLYRLLKSRVVLNLKNKIETCLLVYRQESISERCQ